MKYPWMPLFWGDFLANTMHLSAQEAGAYLFLIAHAWENGGRIPIERVRLARIAHLRADQWHRVWPALQHFFVLESERPSDGLAGIRPIDQWYTHMRVTAELQRLGKISSKRKAAALANAQQVPSKSSANGGANAEQTTPLSTSTSNKQSSLGEGRADAPSRAGAPNGARAPSQPASGGRQGMSPDVGDDYRSPPRQKSDNELEQLPDQPTPSKKWRRHTDDELRAIYAAKHEPNSE